MGCSRGTGFFRSKRAGLGLVIARPCMSATHPGQKNACSLMQARDIRDEQPAAVAGQELYEA